MQVRQLASKPNTIDLTDEDDTKSKQTQITSQIRVPPVAIIKSRQQLPNQPIQKTQNLPIRAVPPTQVRMTRQLGSCNYSKDRKYPQTQKKYFFLYW